MIMMHGITNAQAVQMIAIMFVIGVVVVLLLVLGAVFWPETQRGAAAVSAWVSHRDDEGRLRHELGDYAYREPADPSYVDDLIRVRGVARAIPAVYPPDPLPEPENNPYRTTLAELVASVRPVPASAPTSPARHYSPTIDTAAAHVEYVGGHRAPALIAA